MFNSSNQPWQSIEDDVLLEESVGEICELLVYNDDYNTFEDALCERGLSAVIEGIKV